MIAVTVSRTKDGIQVAGSMGATDNDELIDELACLCADAIDMMARDYEGKDDIGEQLERTLAEAIARHRAWNAEERMNASALEGQEAQGDALH